MGLLIELDPNELLAEGWRVRQMDDRHDLSHALFTLALELARSRHDPIGAANAMLALSNNLLWYCPDRVEQSVVSLENLIDEAMSLFLEAHDMPRVAACLRALGKFDESLKPSEQYDDAVGVIYSLERLSLRASSQGAAESDDLIRRAIALARQLGNTEVIARVLKTEGHHWHLQENVRRAALLEASQLFGELGYRRDQAESLHICATTACEDDQMLKVQLLEAARCIWRELGRYASEASCLVALADAAEQRGDQALASDLRELSEATSKLPER